MTNTQHETHTTSIRTTSWTDREGTTSRYSVVCSVCGNVGQTQEYEADAQAIADRHQEIGGFERPSHGPAMFRKCSCPGSKVVEGHCAVCGAGVEWDYTT